MEDFLNKFTLNFKDDTLQKSYDVSTTQNYKLIWCLVPMLLISTVSLIFLLEQDNDFALMKYCIIINICLLVAGGIAVITILLIMYVFKSKNKTIFNLISSFIFLYFILQLQIMYPIGSETVVIYLYDYYVHKVIVISLLLIILILETSYVYIFIGYLIAGIIIIACSLDGNYSSTWLSIAIFIFKFVGLAAINYIIEKRSKNLFYMTAQIEDVKKLKIDLLENTVCGVLVLNIDHLYFNSKAADLLKLTIDNPDSVLKLNKIFNGHYEEFNEKMEERLKMLILNECENLNLRVSQLIEHFKSDAKYEQTFFIGTKIIENCLDGKMKKTNLKIDMKYNKKDNSLEFYINDISNMLHIEELNLMEKFKKMFLNKFSHEFKNPLLNIKGLLKIIKSKIKESPIVHNSNNRLSYNKVLSLTSETSNEISSFARPLTNLSGNLIHNNTNVNSVGFANLKNLNHIKNLTNFMISLIGDFDFISSSDTENISLEKMCFDIKLMVKKSIKIFETRSELNDKNNMFTFEVDDDIPKVNSDYRRINHIFLNLLSNSYKFTTNGEIKVKIKKSAIPNLISVCVFDSGCGFNPEMLKKLNDETKSNYDNINTQSNIYGIGLGLKSVRILLSVLGRDFKIESDKKEGTSVSFNLFLDIASRTDNINLSNCLLKSSRTINNNTNMNKRRLSLTSINKKLMSPIIKATPFKKINTISGSNPLGLASPSFWAKPKLFKKISDFPQNVIKEEQQQNEHSDIRGNDVINVHINMSTIRTDNATIYLPNLMLNINEKMKVLNYERTDSKLMESNPTQDNQMVSDYLHINNDSMNMSNSLTSQIMFNENSLPLNESIAPKLVRILLVEDEKMIRNSEKMIISNYFKKMNRDVEIVECPDGVDCLYKVFTGLQNRTRYDYLLTDETMNFMRGSLLIQNIRTLIGENIMYDLKIYMLTSYESSSILEMYGDIADGIITKPLTKENVNSIFSLK